MVAAKVQPIRVLQARLSDKSRIGALMKRISVDPYGARIMLPKSVSCLLKIRSVSNIRANILKQEMLSLGGDAAVARGCLTGGVKTTDCLLMGSLAQFARLGAKLRSQPFGLDELARRMTEALADYQKENFRIRLDGHALNLKHGRAAVMGILNVTPDSFSGDGLYPSSVKKVVYFAQEMVKAGADIIDIGGVSSRPGARPVSVKDELKRVIPALKIIARKVKLPISVDTSRPETAAAALDNGAVIINDIRGLRDRKLAKTAARYKAAVVIMHMRGNPRTMQADPRYTSVVDEIIDFLSASIERALEAGIEREKMIVDPGIGFGKTVRHNLEILSRLDELRVLGRPIMVGVSRKSFIGKILDADADKRLCGSLAASIAAVERGAVIIRAHDVAAVKQAMSIVSSINNA